MKITRPGIYRGIDVGTYHADPCPDPSFSQSIGKIILEQSAMHAEAVHPRLRGRPVSGEDAEAEKYDKAKAIGDAAHAIRIGRGKDLAIGYYDSWRTKDAKNFREVASQLGKTSILDQHFREAQAIVEACSRQLHFHAEKNCFENGAGEVALIWQEGKLWFRCLVDWLHDDLLTDDEYKTSGMSMAPNVLGYRAEAGGWHIQAAMIERGLNVLDPENIGRRRHRFIAQEQDAPYGLTVMLMDEHWMTMGRKQLDAAIAIWMASVRSGFWRGYPDVAITPEFPGYKESQWLDREVNEFAPDLLAAG